MNKFNSFIDLAVSDNIRERAATTLGIKSDYVILVEGAIDKFILKKLFPRVSIKIKGKKDDVIRKAKSEENYFAIVDTDHDFFHQRIDGFFNIIDTGDHCCLLSRFLESSEFSNKLTNNIRNDLKRNFSKYYKGLFKYSQVNYDFINILSKKLTAEKLFRGFSFENGVNVGYNSCRNLNWDNIQEYLALSSITIREDDNESFIVFSNEYRDCLSQSGINDHILIDVLFKLVKSEFRGTARISRKVFMEYREYPILKSAIEANFNKNNELFLEKLTDIANSFREFLETKSQDPIQNEYFDKNNHFMKN